MQFRSRFRGALLSALLVFPIALSGCGRGLPNLGGATPPRAGDVSLTLHARVDAAGYSSQSVIAPLTAADVVHVVFRVYGLGKGTETPVLDESGNQVQTDVPAQSLDQPIVLSNLPPESEFRVRAYAYSAQGALLASQISDDSTSYLDVSVANDTRTAGGTIPVNLDNTPFSGTAPASLDVLPGGVGHEGQPYGLSVLLTSSQAAALPPGVTVESADAPAEPGEVAPTDPLIAWMGSDRVPHAATGSVPPDEAAGAVSAQLAGVVLTQDQSLAEAVLYRVTAPEASVLLRFALPPGTQGAPFLAYARGTTTLADLDGFVSGYRAPAGATASGYSVQALGLSPGQSLWVGAFVGSMASDIQSAIGACGVAAFVVIERGGSPAVGLAACALAGGALLGDLINSAWVGNDAISPLPSPSPSPTPVAPPVYTQVFQSNYGQEGFGDGGLDIEAVDFGDAPKSDWGAYTAAANLSTRTNLSGGQSWSGTFTISGPAGSSTIDFSNAGAPTDWVPFMDPRDDPLDPKICGSWGCILALMNGSGSALQSYTKTVEFFVGPG